MAKERTITRSWPSPSERTTTALLARDDLLRESEVAAGVFCQSRGPFTTYRREVSDDGTDCRERTAYTLDVPLFGWLFALPVRRELGRRRPEGSGGPWWAPPDQLSARQVSSLALLTAAAMSAGFANTLFTQTANFAARDFGVGNFGQGVGGAVVRVGVVIALPFTVLADRLGRRRTIVLLAWLAPLLCALGAVAPSFAGLVASQTIGRPLGIALSLLATVAAAEDMPRNSRAYALSLLAMAAGLGAGIAVAALRLADVGIWGWRLVYLLSLLWVPVAVLLWRRLTETRRFETAHRHTTPLPHRRLVLVATVAVLANLFVAPASFFQNRYLDDVRGYTAGGITLFTLATGTPASLGLVAGGRLADLFGRRKMIAVCTPLSTVALVAGFWVGGSAMWAAAVVGGLTAGLAYPAFAVYRAELFSTANRGRANGIIATGALLSGSLGIIAAGWLRDHGWSFGAIMTVAAVGQMAAVVLAVRGYPETAHLTLEQLNPSDPPIDDDGDGLVSR